jgi:hypothetical protein
MTDGPDIFVLKYHCPILQYHYIVLVKTSVREMFNKYANFVHKVKNMLGMWRRW